MKQALKHVVALGSMLLLGTAVMAKLPPLSDEAKAKAAEAAAKTAWSGKVDAYQLCKSQDKVVASVKKTKPGAASACVDPGPFVYTPAVPATSAQPPAAAFSAAAKKS